MDHTNDGSDSDSSAGDAQQSSPLRASPVTSPIAHSPPTSPLQHSAPSSSSSPASSPRRKRLRSGTPYRTTLWRRALAELNRDSSSEDDYVEDNRGESIEEQFDGSQHEDGGRNISSSSGDYSSLEERQPSSDSDSVVPSDDSDIHNSSDSSGQENHSVSGESESGSEDDGNPSLFEGSQVTKFKANFEVLHLYVKERWTKASLNNTIKLIKNLLPAPNEMPSSSTAILKWLEDFTTVSKEREYYYCSECGSSVANSNEKCTCGCELSDVFFSFPLEEQVKHFFENRDLASIIDNHCIHHDRRDGYICDIVDGTEYINVKKHLNGQYDLVLLWNTDGVSLSLSSKQELWPILSTICEVPPRLRPSYMIVSGIYVGAKKPNMNVFLQPFVDSLKQIFLKGGVSWIHPVSKEICKSMVVAPALCADAPAKAMVLIVKQFSARFGCNVCEQKAKSIDPDPNEENPKKRKKSRRLVFQEEPARLRTGPRMDDQGVLAELRGKSRKGVLGPAVVSGIPLFDRAECVCADYLHLVLQGSVKYFLKLIFFVRGPWYLGDKIENMNQFLQTIKVPDFVKRLVRSLDEFKFYKASEFRAFLLYYSLPLFKELGWPEEYMQHWLLLVGAMYNLLKDKISKTELDAANVMLRCFVRSVQILYGDRYCTYNLHNLLHLPLLVERWGPLWATSSFPFESYNGYISSHIHGTKDFGKELLNTIKIMQGVSILKNVVHAGQRGFPRVPLENAIILVGKRLSENLLTLSEKAVLSKEGIDSFHLYSRGKVGRNLFSTKLYDEHKKRANSYIQFFYVNDNVRHGQVLYYVKANDNVYCIVNVAKVNHANIFFHVESRYQLKNIVPVVNSEELRVINFEKIISRILKVGDFFCIPPNTYEINL